MARTRTLPPPATAMTPRPRKISGRTGGRPTLRGARPLSPGMPPGSRARSREGENSEPVRVTLAAALETALAAAAHLTDRDAAATAAARALAARIDAWDVIVRWASEDAGALGRPKVPANDNTSLPTYLRYLDALQLVPPAEKAKPGPASTASPAQRELNDLRAGLRLVPDGEVG